jgi:hypothetical protein
MKIAIVGHHRMTEMVHDILRKTHPAVETETILLETEDTVPAERQIRQVEPLMDGLLFTGRIPFDLLNHVVLSHKPWAYVKRDAAQLLSALLKAVRTQGWKAEKVSLDSYEPEEVMEIFRHIGASGTLPRVYGEPAFREGFLEDLIRFHQRNIASGKADFCLTGISSVYEALGIQGLPCMILDPSTESVRDAMQLLMLKRESRMAEERQIVVLAIEQDLPDEHALIRENEYQMALESMGISQEVYLFAQRVQAAVVEKEMGKFMLFTTKNLLEVETEQFRSFNLMNGKSGMRFGSLSIGIGYGETAREAKFNANLGLLKAKKGGGNRAYLVAEHQTIGPMLPKEPAAAEEYALLDGRFQEAALKSGVSLNTVMKLQGLMDFERKDTFTPAELAKACRMAPRSANRLLEKLIHGGFAHIVGSSVKSTAGRPCRIIRIAFR